MRGTAPARAPAPYSASLPARDASLAPRRCACVTSRRTSTTTRLSTGTTWAEAIFFHITVEASSRCLGLFLCERQHHFHPPHTRASFTSARRCACAASRRTSVATRLSTGSMWVESGEFFMGPAADLARRGCCQHICQKQRAQRHRSVPRPQQYMFAFLLLCLFGFVARKGPRS